MTLCRLHTLEEVQTHTFPLFTNYRHFILNAFYPISSFYCMAGIILLPAFVEMSSGIKCHFTSDETHTSLWMMWWHGGFRSANSTVACQWNANRRWQSDHWCSSLSFSLLLNYLPLWQDNKKALSSSGHAKRHFIEDFCPLLQRACLITDWSIPGPFPTLGTGNDAILGAVTLTGPWRGCLSIAQLEMAILLTLLASSVVVVIKAREEKEEEALNDTNALIIALFDSNCGN